MAQYELPENLSALSDDELNAALNEGLDAFKELGLTAESDEDTIAEGERIAPLVQAVRAEQQARVAAAESRAARAAELLATVPEQTAEVTESEEEAPVEEPVAEVAVEEEATTTHIENEESVVSDNIPEPVAASAAQSPVARAAANTPETVVPRRAAAVLTASADVSGFAAGQELDDLGQVGAALVSRLRTLPKMPSSVSVMQRFGAAQIRKTGYGELVQGAGLDDYSLMQRAGEESRLSGGSLVAAGGWCAPAETVWDMCSLEVVDGILDLPEVNITRGGIRFTEGPDFSSIYTQCGFHQVPGQNGAFFNSTKPFDATGTASADDCKDCCKVDCPPWQEVPLEAVGLCIKADILTNHAWPELVRRHVEGALVGHAHKVNAFLISKIKAGASAAVALPDPTASFAVDALEWEAVAMRQKFHLGRTATIEIVAPFWYKNLVRIDIGRRNGQDWNSVTDAQVDAAFTSRNLKVQWVLDLQDLTVVAGSATAIPATANILMYPAGTWAKGGSEIISLDAVYDSVGLEGNVYTGLFVEESILALQRCTETWQFTVQTCASGLTGAQEAACLGSDAA